MSSSPRRLPKRIVIAIAVLLALSISVFATAHEVEPHVHIQAYVEESADALDFAVRVPLAAIRDVELSLTNEGFLDVERADAALRQAAALWILGELQVAARGVALSAPTLQSATAAAPSDRGFDTAHAAFNRASRPLANIDWRHLYLDVRFDFRLREDQRGGDYAVHSAWSRLGIETVTSIDFQAQDGYRQRLAFTGDPGVIMLRPGAAHIAQRFTSAGLQQAATHLAALTLLVALVVSVGKVREARQLLMGFIGALLLALIALASWTGPPLWLASLLAAAIATTTLYVSAENALGLRLPIWVTGAIAGAFVGASLAVPLLDISQYAGQRTWLAASGYALGAALISGVSILALSATWLRARDWRIRRPLVIGISVVLAHAAWHWLETELEILAMYGLFA